MHSLASAGSERKSMSKITSKKRIKSKSKSMRRTFRSQMIRKSVILPDATIQT